MKCVRPLRIGTRRSKLAMWQTEWIQSLLLQQRPDLQVEIVHVQTLGDRDKATSLVGLERTGIFTKELEDALLSDECDVAVHSFKDLATELPQGLVLGAVPKRANPNDAFVSRDSKTLSQLDVGAVIGTSSLRRRSQILSFRPDLVVEELRGNVPTRLKAAGVDLGDDDELKRRSIDGTVMALAGLQRLSLENHATEVLPTIHFLPAPAQGAVAVELRDDDAQVARLLASISHKETRLAIAAERMFLAVMEGGCHMPLGALAKIEGNEIELDGIVLSLDGKQSVRGKTTGQDPQKTGEELAIKLKNLGAGEIIQEVTSCLLENYNETPIETASL